jgi:hypothetical protein
VHGILRASSINSTRPGASMSTGAIAATNGRPAPRLHLQSEAWHLWRDQTPTQTLVSYRAHDWPYENDQHLDDSLFVIAGQREDDRFGIADIEAPPRRWTRAARDHRDYVHPPSGGRSAKQDYRVGRRHPGADSEERRSARSTCRAARFQSVTCRNYRQHRPTRSVCW